MGVSPHSFGWTITWIILLVLGLFSSYQNILKSQFCFRWYFQLKRREKERTTQNLLLMGFDVIYTPWSKRVSNMPTFRETFFCFIVVAVWMGEKKERTPYDWLQKWIRNCGLLHRNRLHQVLEGRFGEWASKWAIPVHFPTRLKQKRCDLEGKGLMFRDSTDFCWLPGLFWNS